MFYIKTVLGNSVEVVDTGDWSVECHDKGTIIEYAKQVKIHGVNGNDVHVFDLDEYLNAVMTKDRLNGITSKYMVDLNGNIILTYLEIPKKMQYSVADGTFRIEHKSEKFFVQVRGVFSDCDFSIVLPESCKAINASAFSSSKVTNINLRHIVYLGDYAFSGCKNLRTVDLSTLPNDKYKSAMLTESEEAVLGDSCFEKSGVVKINFGNFNTIPTACCSDCENLETVVATNVLNISDKAFERCVNLRDFQFKSSKPKSKVSISSKAFTACPNLSDKSREELQYYIKTVRK